MSADLIAKDQLEIHTGQESLTLYQFETEVAKHYFCKNCGIYPFHETRRKPGHLRINLGCVKNVNTLTLEYDVLMAGLYNMTTKSFLMI